MKKRQKRRNFIPLHHILMPWKGITKIMNKQPPRSREKRVTGPGQTIHKRGSGLGTGPVGSGQSGRGQSGSSPNRPSSRRPTPRSGSSSGGFGKLLILLLVLLFGGGGTLLSNHSGQSTQPGSNGSPGQANQANPQAGQTGQSSGSQQGMQGGGIDLASLLGGLGGGNVSGGWVEEANTGKLNTSVASSARQKRVKLLGGGRDTATIMVYMCGTDLESRSGMGTADLQEMLAADFGDSLNLLVYTGGCTGWRNNQVSSDTNQIWQVKDKQLICRENHLGSHSMTDPATLTGFIQ